MPDLKLLFLQMAVILIAAKLLARVFKLIRQPEVLGEMAAGILLGPSLLGRIAPDVMNGLFPASSLGTLYALSQLGLVLFMFLVGLEIHPGTMRSSARPVVITSLLSIAAPFLCGAILAWRLYDSLGTGSGQLAFVLFIGAAMGVTAFPVLARILSERNLMRSRIGMIAISCAAVNDVAAWCLLAVITVVSRPQAGYGGLGVRFAGLIVYLLVMMFAVRPLLKRLIPSAETPGPHRFALTMIVLLASVWTTEALAIHALFGAFLAGAVMPRGPALELGLRQRMESLALILLLPLFFAYNGLRTSLSLVNTPHLWSICAWIILIAIASKLLVTAASLRASDMTWRDSLSVGVLMNTRGLVELVILNVGLELRILSPLLFSMMVIMALLTTFMTGPLLDWVHPQLQAERSPSPTTPNV